ncbi:hypothetical protein AB0G74_16620 [Streptomyces sp. NPDC020875]|uniref:hypothetical protein n=1 Tax=Streptomyces sp. NPDC020875 TaxID=3154898 RepID=UPI0033F5E87D
MRREPRNLDEALARARVFDGRYTPAHLADSRRRITEKLNDLHTMLTVPGAFAARPAGPPPLHDRAAHDLRALCQGIIHDADAARRIARFDTTRDPGGALAFACLLVLAGIEEGAQFWWQFAAGAGNPSAAVCLYLLHLRRGDIKDAEFWVRQSAALDNEPCQYRPVTHQLLKPNYLLVNVTIRMDVAIPEHSAAIPEKAVRDAIQSLDVGQIDGLGPVPQPSPRLAHQLQDLIASSTP